MAKRSQITIPDTHQADGFDLRDQAASSPDGLSRPFSAMVLILRCLLGGTCGKYLLLLPLLLLLVGNTQWPEDEGS